MPWLVYPLVAVGHRCHGRCCPRLTKAVPAPLVAIVVADRCSPSSPRSTVPTVGDEGELPDSLPSLFLPDVPFTLDTLQIIAPYALAMALVGLLESLMTAKLVDDITDTHSHKTREAWGQGVANIVTGFFGGMGGCAMIGQTMINVKASGARTRISTFLAGVFLLVLVVGLGDVVALIPMAALVAVMIMVSVGTFDWHSIRPATLQADAQAARPSSWSPPSSSSSPPTTSPSASSSACSSRWCCSPAGSPTSPTVDRPSRTPDGRHRASTRSTGELFFASSNDLVTQFDYADDPDQRRHRPDRVAHLGRLHRRRAGRDHHEVRAQGQDRRPSMG